METTVVVFRKWGNGDIIALFPFEREASTSFACLSYEHIGQHGGADYPGVVRETRPASPAEYAELKAELERIGYVLEIRQRANRK